MLNEPKADDFEKRFYKVRFFPRINPVHRPRYATIQAMKKQI